MKIKSLVAALCGLTSALAASAAHTADVPRYVNFQAVLRDDSGNLLQGDTVNLEFKILDQDGSQLYYESQPAVNLVRSSVNVMIGEGLNQAGTPTGGLDFLDFSPVSGTKYLQMRIDGNQPGGPMEMGSVPYAVYAQTALKIDPNIVTADLPDVFVTTEELNTAINAEASSRQTSDTNLQNALTAEVTARQTADTNIQNNINSESASRTNADNSLTTRMNVAHNTNGTIKGGNYSAISLKTTTSVPSGTNLCATPYLPAGFSGSDCGSNVLFIPTFQQYEGDGGGTERVTVYIDDSYELHVCADSRCAGNSSDNKLPNLATVLAIGTR